jgi:hypothetical protein
MQAQLHTTAGQSTSNQSLKQATAVALDLAWDTLAVTKQQLPQAITGHAIPTAASWGCAGHTASDLNRKAITRTGSRKPVTLPDDPTLMSCSSSCLQKMLQVLAA